MRIVSLLVAIFARSHLVTFRRLAQEGKKEDQQSEQRKMPAAFENYPILKRMWSNIPPTLAEAHAELERLMSPETLAEIDAMPSEKDMIKYHFSWGLNMRNGWGLWAGSPLARHMQELGFTHPDDMSGVILATFWRKRHGQDLSLEELTAAAKKIRGGCREGPGTSVRYVVQRAKAAMREHDDGAPLQGAGGSHGADAGRVAAPPSCASCPAFVAACSVGVYRPIGRRLMPYVLRGYYFDPRTARSTRFV